MSSDDSLVDRVSSFVSDNKRGIILGVAAAAVAVGGVAYYVASSRSPSGAADEESLMSGKKKDKKKKKHKKSVKDKDGPILEERKPKASEESDDGCASLPFCSRVVCSLCIDISRSPSDGRTDSGTSYRGNYFADLACPCAHSRIGAQGASGFIEAKGQRRVPGPKVYPCSTIVYTRHRRVTSTRTRFLQQPCRMLREYGTTTAREGSRGLR
jgi:hypothetical protein